LQSKEERRNFYDKIASVYDVLADKSERPMREIGLNFLDAQAGEHILEIGFGTGHCLIELAGAVGADGKVYGIDISPKMLQRANELLQDHGLETRVELQEGDAEQLPYQTDSLDAIFMSFTLELFDTPEIPGLLSECKRVLKPDGRLGVVAISKEGERGMVVKAFEWTHRHFPNLMDCRPIYAQQSLEAAGFCIDEVRVEHMWVPVEIVLAHNRSA
jgi:demethylmenaquinone methyltransferase/2-methoxy-6-polyprenyl-1,4-benzoquinol methylase